MIKIMDIEETKTYLRNNFFEYDSYILPIDAAVKAGIIVPVPDRKDRFIPLEYEINGVTWHLNSVRKLTDEEMKENDLYLRYRYESEVVKAPLRYGGITLVEAGFDI